MFLISQLNKDNQEHVSYLSNNGAGKSLLASIAIGKAIANTLFLPSSEVDSLEQQYRATWLIEVNRQVSALNELFLLNVEDVQLFVYKFYAMRYAVMVPRKMVFCTNPATVLEDFIGVSQNIDQATIAVMRASPIELMKVANAVTAILVNLAETK